MSKAPPYALLRAELKHAKELNAVLLAALERVSDAYGFDPSIESSIWQEVFAAIAKAKAQP